MKTIVFIISLLLTFIGCKSSECNEARTIIVDLSDTMAVLSELTGTKIIKDLQFQSDKYAGAFVKLSLITDRRFNKEFVSVIKPSSIWDSDELKRIREIERFTSNVNNSISNIKTLTPGIAKSRIFEILFLELNELACSKQFTNRNLDLISDLQQNSEDFNSYDSLFMVKLIKNPKNFNHLMDSLYHPASSYKGITICIYHQPSNAVEDTKFYEMSMLLKGYLKGKGATVTIKTSLL